HDRRLLRRPGQRRGELRGADRDRHRHRTRRAGCGRRHRRGRVSLRRARAALPGHPSARRRPAPALLRDDPARWGPRTADGAALAEVGWVPADERLTVAGGGWGLAVARLVLAGGAAADQAAGAVLGPQPVAEVRLGDLLEQ